MISREQATLARDHALAARNTLDAHKGTCRKCTEQPIPCELGGMLQRGAAKIAKEARDALVAYLPPGTPVTYNGKREEYRGKTWTVIGVSRRTPWSTYVLQGRGVAPFAASLASVQISSREAQQREGLNMAKDTVALCVAVMAKYGVNMAVTTDRSSTGIVRVTWSSAELITAENRATQDSATEAGQYLAAALYLLQALRQHTQRREWAWVARDLASARKLAERTKARV